MILVPDSEETRTQIEREKFTRQILHPVKAFDKNAINPNYESSEDSIEDSVVK